VGATVSTAGGTAACEVAGVVKRYGGVQALTGVDLAIHPGQVHAIVGENGAGKSTLMKIVAGAERPDAGRLTVRGRPAAFASVAEANRAGIAIVFQELHTYPQLDVLTNLFIGHESLRLGLVRRQEMKRRARPVLAEIGLDVDLDRETGTLRLAERQLVEIARALLLRSDILILDEPNSALSAAETERLFGIVRGLRDRGVAVIYVSHRLEEVFAIADRVTVLRNGAVVMSRPIAELTIPDVVEAMVGRRPSEFFAAGQRRSRREEADERALRLEGVSAGAVLVDVDLEARPGEVVGLAGLEGSGPVAAMEVIFGVRRPESGRVVLPGGRPGPRSVPAAVRAGIALIPSDRRNAGLMLDHTVVENISLITAGTLGRMGPAPRRVALERRAEHWCAALQIKVPSVWAPVHQLSGGTQQKVVFAKWLETDPSVLLLDDPTRGVDVGTKVEIYEMARRLAREGRIVLFTTSELPEFTAVCDRVVVFHRGRVRGELEAGELEQERLLQAINTGEL
jgi:ABC-type sugar transport system ATPase subunit